MTVFKIRAQSLERQQEITLTYDTSDSSLYREDGTRVGFTEALDHGVATVFDKDAPVGKVKDVKILKIQLGLSCNYECTYCSQRFVPRADETNPNDVQEFIDRIENSLNLGDGSGVRIELWGGEPFVYWKTMKPLVESLRLKYPQVEFITITNGSLLTDEKVDWMYENGFSFAISHDGPAMKYRGPDPLENSETRRVILRAYRKFRPENRVSFNCMLHAQNTSRVEVIKFFQELTGDKLVPIGEGGIVDAYDADAVAVSLNTLEQQFQFRRTALQELLTADLSNWMATSKVQSFVQSIATAKTFESVEQKCGMDRKDSLALDLKGNVLTCQNVSSVSTNPAGTSHLAGNIDKLEDVKISAATHLSKRAECPTCPVVHLCHGSCMFLQGSLWKTSCDNAYSDNIGPFAYAIAKLTGFIPVWIEHESLPDHRKDVFGSMIEHKEKKSFPIPIVSA